jgi:sugar lactone lactonase YvrE
VNPPPDIIISTTLTGDESLNNPAGLAFDKDGNLWVVNFYNNTLVKFSPDQLSKSGAPVPPVILNAISGSLSGPNGLAFDIAGNLWVSNSNSTVIKLVAATLNKTGSPLPEVVLNGFSGIDIGFVAFNPPPSNLPITQK